MVWARPAEHETIRATLAELDKSDLDDAGRVVKSYTITTTDASTLLGTLQTLFATRPTVRLSVDAKNNKIVAMASEEEHKTIANVIDEVEHGSPLDATAQFKVHPLRDADPTVVMQVLANLVGKNSRAILSVDAASGQLVAVATPAEHETIQTAIDQMQSQGRQLAVFQLDLVEPFAAELAIEKLFGQQGRRRGRGDDVPIVESDAMTARLYVRAAPDDIDEIRDLLVKMGETHLANSDGTGGTLRIIPFSGDLSATLTEIERIWPRLSNHPLRSAQYAAGHGPGRAVAADIRPEALRREPLPAESPEDEDPEPMEKQTRRSVPRSLIQTVAYQQEPAAESPEKPEAKPAAEPTEASEPKPANAPEAAKEPAPIIISPGEDRITIMSDDPEAIRQFEALLRALTPSAGAGGRDVTVYPLHTANSTTTADLLKRIFRGSDFGFGDLGGPVIESDQRLNSIVVYASRNDRAVIERLLKVLDSDEIPESLVANRPRLIPVEHTDAASIEAVLRDIYQTQLTSGSPAQELPIPRGASRDIAAVIQQINSSASGPLMTLGVDALTNSIVVMAPTPLADEVAELVAKLDEAALNDTSRSVKVVRLKSTSADEVQKVLEALIRDAAQRRGRGRNR